jgi:hypothetical protein
VISCTKVSEKGNEGCKTRSGLSSITFLSRSPRKRMTHKRPFLNEILTIKER